MLYLSSAVIYPKSVAGPLKFVIWYYFLMPSGILCSTIGKDALSLSWSNLLGKMVLSNVWRKLSRFVIIDVSHSNRAEVATGNMMIDVFSSF